MMTAKPEVQRWEPLRVAGPAASFQVMGSGGADHLEIIPRLWGQLLSGRSEIPRAARGRLLGVCREIKGRRDRREYLAGVELLGDVWDVPNTMTVWEIPAARYAKFTHRGPMVGLAETLRHALETELPAAGLTPSGTHEIEHYDHRFKLGVANSELDLYIALA